MNYRHEYEILSTQGKLSLACIYEMAVLLQEYTPYLDDNEGGPHYIMRYSNLPNIRYNSNNKWLGLVDERKGFCQFVTIADLRALLILLNNYSDLLGYTIGESDDKAVIDAFITRYAPPSENNTRAYVQYIKDKYDKLYNNYASGVNYALKDAGKTPLTSLLLPFIAFNICRYENSYLIDDDEEAYNFFVFLAILHYLMLEDTDLPPSQNRVDNFVRSIYYLNEVEPLDWTFSFVVYAESELHYPL